MYTHVLVPAVSYLITHIESHHFGSNFFQFKLFTFSILLRTNNTPSLLLLLSFNSYSYKDSNSNVEIFCILHSGLLKFQ